MSALSETGAITYEMGTITVLDRARLEAIACECYPIVRSEFDRLLTDQREPTPSPLDALQTSKDGKTLVGDAVPRQDATRIV